MLRIDGAQEVRAAALLYRRAPREVQSRIRREAKVWAPTLRAAAVRRATDPVSRAVAESGKVTVTARGVRAVFGAARWRGVDLRRVARPFEFGTSQPDAWSDAYLTRTAAGRSVKVQSRRTQRQIPARSSGRFAHAAVAETTPDLVGRWVRAIATAVDAS
jgi:hypothetical protein